MKRTTLVLDPDLFSLLKREAAASGHTLREVVNTLLRRALGGAVRPKTRFRLKWKTVRGRLQPGVNLDDRDALYDLMDDPS